MSGPIAPTNPNAAQPPAPKGQVVQIVSLPDGLKDNARSIRIEGEVIAQNKDGSVRVRTDKGEMDIQVRGKQPQVGAQIEVDIPAGHPPRAATIRPAPVPVPTMPLPQTSPPAANIPLPQTPVTGQPPQSPTSQQPAPVEIDPNAPVPKPQAPQTSSPVQDITAPPQLPKLPPLQAGQIVQLTPLPDALETSVPQVLPILDTPAETIITKTAAQAALIAEKKQGGLISNLLQAVKSVLPATPAIVVQPTTIATPPDAIIPAPLQNNLTLVASPQQTQPTTLQNFTPPPVLLEAKIVSITTPSGQTVYAPQTPNVPTPNVQILPQAAPFTATVTHVTPQNQPIIPIVINHETGATQNFIIQTPPATVSAGSQITLLPQLISTPAISTALKIQSILPQTILQTPQPVATQTPATAMPPAWRALLPLMQPASIWPAFDDVFQSFYQATPQAAQILGRIIPSPANAQNLGPAVLLFAAAARTGALENWMGEKKLEMIQKLGKEGLLSRLSGELSSLAQNTDAPATDWKSYPIPMLYQHEVAKVMLHTRQESEEEGRERNEDATRFIMDVSLNRMGEVQLDATVRGKQVNLIVRTQNAISLSMQDAMRTAYAKALDNTDIYGEIGFQADINNFVQVLKREDALAQA